MTCRLLNKQQHAQAMHILDQAEIQCAHMMNPAVRAKYTLMQARAAADSLIKNGIQDPAQAALVSVDCLMQYECARAMDPSNSGLVTICLLIACLPYIRDSTCVLCFARFASQIRRIAYMHGINITVIIAVSCSGSVARSASSCKQAL